eukprot:TRINITY_DN12638_c0_g1_i1.p1 TRINITY_DN12638_c0_g1~~TRINITY_DN12638_c0_g1_i1.p1  ORF type:complete len:344 (+),score=73.62 TRINITY_DN12638_c0_g1_i1:47-1078(+)
MPQTILDEFLLLKSHFKDQSIQVCDEISKITTGSPSSPELQEIARIITNFRQFITSVTQSNLFSTVPREILKVIVSYCDIKTIGRLERTCKRFHSLDFEDTWKNWSIEYYKQIVSPESVPVFLWAKTHLKNIKWKRMARHLSNPKPKEGISYEWNSKQSRLFIGFYKEGKLQDVKHSPPFMIFLSKKPKKNSLLHGSFLINDGNGYSESVQQDGMSWKGHREKWVIKNGEWFDGTGGHYTGTFEKGVPHGQGERTRSGSEYTGEWKNGYYDGKGKLIYASGPIYEGEWIKGKRNGQGTCSYQDGSHYNGSWENDLRNGQGTFTFKDARKYIGEWKNNKTKWLW